MERGQWDSPGKIFSTLSVRAALDVVAASVFFIIVEYFLQAEKKFINVT